MSGPEICEEGPLISPTPSTQGLTQGPKQEPGPQGAHGAPQSASPPLGPTLLQLPCQSNIHILSLRNLSPGCKRAAGSEKAAAESGAWVLPCSPHAIPLPTPAHPQSLHLHPQGFLIFGCPLLLSFQHPGHLRGPRHYL